MIIVVPICNKDGALAIKNLEWQRDLDGKIDCDCILAVDESTSEPIRNKAKALAESIYRKTVFYLIPVPPVQGWPQAPNHVWQYTARFIAAFPKKLGHQPWLFLEPDAIPVKPGWWKAIDEEYKLGKKPFMGHVVTGIVENGGHLTGVAVYPPIVANFLTDALMTQNTAWDVIMGVEWNKSGLIPQMVHNAWKLFQHVWGVDEQGNASRTGGKPVTFKCKEDVFRWVDLDAAIFHRCKDGSLIDQLFEIRCKKDTKEFNVPDHTGTTHTIPKIVVKPGALVPEIKYTGRAEILIVTYHKDKPWLDYCLRAMKKYLHGFSGITLVVPERDRQVFAEITRIYHHVNMQTWPEVEGKGMLDHMVQICNADKWCPRADIVVHFDPDCIFHTTTTVDEYVQNGKPVMLKRAYSKLYDPVHKAMSDCFQWKAVVEKALGFETDAYTMCRHPSCHPISVYPELRKWIEAAQNKPFAEFVLDGRNSFPQTFAEFPTLGAFGWEMLRERYHWIDIDKEAAPVDRQMTFWSHGPGLTAQIREQIEGYLR